MPMLENLVGKQTSEVFKTSEVYINVGKPRWKTNLRGFQNL